MVHIKDMPALKGKAAERFEEKYRANNNREKIDFSEEYRNSMSILAKKRNPQIKNKSQV